MQGATLCCVPAAPSWFSHVTQLASSHMLLWGGLSCAGSPGTAFASPFLLTSEREVRTKGPFCPQKFLNWWNCPRVVLIAATMHRYQVWATFWWDETYPTVSRWQKWPRKLWTLTFAAYILDIKPSGLLSRAQKTQEPHDLREVRMAIA